MIGVVADDLTGAAELGAIGHRYGLRAEVVLGGRPGLEADLVCIDTDSRSCPWEEAGIRAAAAARNLLAAGAKWIYKKVDSVLRGPILAELEALLRELCLPSALLVPANPEAGRTVYDGRYFISGKPVHETSFRLDPEYPRSSSVVSELLGAGKGKRLQVCRVGDPLPPAGIVVGEATSAADLQYWSRQWASSILPAGAAGFFAAMLQATGHQMESPVRTSLGLRPERELFVCGSASQSTRDFIVDMRACGVPVFGLPASLAQGAAFTGAGRDGLAERVAVAWQSHRRVVLEIGLLPASDSTVARGLADRLADLAHAVLERGGGAHVYAEGGATAVALAQRMGWERLKVVHQLPPGAATLQVAGQSAFLFTVKPGSYAWPSEICAGA
jgi:uncharacterized protein YgbK (DUF1537 family)